MPEVVQLGGWDVITTLNDLAVGTPEPGHATVGRESRERIESGGTDMPPDRLKILARGATSAQTKIEDELIDVREHAASHGRS